MVNGKFPFICQRGKKEKRDEDYVCYKQLGCIAKLSAGKVKTSSFFCFSGSNCGMDGWMDVSPLPTCPSFMATGMKGRLAD